MPLSPLISQALCLYSVTFCAFMLSTSCPFSCFLAFCLNKEDHSFRTHQSKSSIQQEHCCLWHSVDYRRSSTVFWVYNLLKWKKLRWSVSGFSRFTQDQKNACFVKFMIRAKQPQNLNYGNYCKGKAAFAHLKSSKLETFSTVVCSCPNLQMFSCSLGSGEASVLCRHNNITISHSNLSPKLIKSSTTDCI